MALLTMTLVSGCAAGDASSRSTAPAFVGPGSELVTSEVPPTSAPAFLSTPQDEIDLLPPHAIAVLKVDPATARFQGKWNGKEVYLAVAGAVAVRVVTGITGDDESWASGGSLDNRVIGLSDDESGSLQYLPQGTGTVPNGWTALSDFVIVK